MSKNKSYITNPKIIYNHFLPIKKKYLTVNIYGIIFTRLSTIPPYIMQHERVHTTQALDFCRFRFIGFTIYYIVYLYYKFKYKDKSNNPLEKEALVNQFNFNYTFNRPKFAWKEYKKAVFGEGSCLGCFHLQSYDNLLGSVSYKCKLDNVCLHGLKGRKNCPLQNLYRIKQQEYEEHKRN